uniref:Isochorismatase domain containing 2 n=1 Tax=Seriola lalandi dorsalis TaxID=1841481 RepID=A0A3B4Z3P0_SERLL
MANIGRLSTKDAVIFLCDMQEKFRPNIFQFTNIVSNAARLLQASRVLGIPPILTEQYPKGLGPTVPELGAADLKAHAKTSFTMMIEEVEKELQALGNPKQAILCGIEAHACIACTTFDLLEKGMEVHIVADAVSSRRYLCCIVIQHCHHLHHIVFCPLCANGSYVCNYRLLCLPPQPDGPFVCSVPTEAERSLPHHHRGRPAAAGPRRQTPQLQGGAHCSCSVLHSSIIFVCLDVS